MSRVIRVVSKDGKKSHEFQLESLQKVEYFQSLFSERWNNKSNNDNSNNNNNNYNKGEEKTELIEQDQFPIGDLIVLIEQIVEQSCIDPLEVSYQQLPSIVLCADFLAYKIDSQILMKFMQECIPALPQDIEEKWREMYTDPPYQVLIDTIRQYFQNERTLTENEQKDILCKCITQQNWNFKTWFISDKVFLEVFADKMGSYNSRDGYIFTWKLICRDNLIRLWCNEVVMQTIMTFFSRNEGKCAPLKISILSSIIQWGLDKDVRYLNMPKKYQNLNLYIRQYLCEIDDPNYPESIQKAQALIELALNRRKQWAVETTKYNPGVLVQESMSILDGDQIWLSKIFDRLNSNELKVIRCSVLEIANKPYTNEKLLEAIKKYFVF